jgi:hypothetical protein
MIRRLSTCLILWCACAAGSALADAPATRPTAQDMATPRDAMLAYDHWCVDLQDFDDAPAFYTARTDDEKTYVQQSMKYAHVSAQMERLLRKTFGSASCTDVMHEYGDADVPDLRAADISINGNVAAVHIAAGPLDFQMVKVDGAWLIDSSSLILTSGGLDNAVQASNNQIARLQPIADGLQNGNFKTVQDVIHAIDLAMAAPQH